MLIPSAAVQRNGVQAFVYKVNSNNTASIQNIVEQTTDSNISAVEGLNPGDTVSLTGFDKLQDGTKVEIAAISASYGHRQWRCRRHSGRKACRRANTLNPSRIFVLRPVATALLMVAILVIGLASYTTLPVSALPEADYPTIQVQTFYPGASPQVMSSAVTAPLERQFGQVAGLSQMTSTSSDGSSVIVLQFALNLNIDVAEQEVQAAINAAQGYLPTDLPVPPVYSKSNPADAPVLTLALTSTAMPLSRVEDLVDTRLAPKISQLSGVGLVTISGGQKPAVRVQANPTALASYGVNLEDLRNALTAESVNSAKGSFDGPAQNFQINADDQLLSSAGYRDLVVAYKNGAPVMLTDVARVSDGIENTKLAAWMNETPAVIVNIQRQPGANTIQVVTSIEELLPKLQATLPVAIKLTVLTDRTNTIRASVRDVEFELMLTIALVVMVIFLFLRNLSATIIPSVAVPLSLIGTFAVMQALGYSLNNLTLMAFTISTGFVVDDAIVMLENISRYLEEGLSPMQAALQGAQQIGFTIISLTISLIAVLIPLLFMGDIVGRLFREFAVTLSVTILISAFVSLTLTPMMAARILRHTPESEQTRFYHYTEGLFKRVIAAYGRSLRWVFRFEIPMLLIAAAMLVLTVVLYIEIPKGFFPTQDTGIIQGISQAPESISFTAMSRKQQQLAHEILKDPAVESLSSFIGADGVNTTLNSGRIQINLKDPAIRGLTASQVIRRLDRNLRSVPGIQLYMQPVQDLTVDDRASRTEYQYTLEDPDPAELGIWTGKLVDAMRKLPQLRDVATDDQPNGVTAQLAIDRATASRMNITADTIDSTLYDAFGQRQISTLYTQSNQYHVILEALPEFQKDPRKLDSLYVQGAATTTVAGAAASTSGRRYLRRQLGYDPHRLLHCQLLNHPGHATFLRRQQQLVFVAHRSEQYRQQRVEHRLAHRFQSVDRHPYQRLVVDLKQFLIHILVRIQQPNLGPGLSRGRRLHQHHAHSRATLRLHPFRDEALSAHHLAPGPVSRGNRILQCCRRLLAGPGGRRRQSRTSAPSYAGQRDRRLSGNRRRLHGYRRQ